MKPVKNDNHTKFQRIHALMICALLGLCGCGGDASPVRMTETQNTAAQSTETQISGPAETEAQAKGPADAGTQTDAGTQADPGAQAEKTADAGTQADAGAQAEKTADAGTQTDAGAQAEKTADAGTQRDVGTQVEDRAPEVSAVKNDLFSAHGKLSVKGTQLVDKDGKAFRLRGISTHGLSWFPQYVNREAFRSLRDEWGCNVVRLAMYTAEGNGYCTGDEKNRKALKDLVDQGIGYATELDMYVIVDWHILSDGNPNTYREQARDYFAYMSRTHRDNDHVLYEICNEPNGGTTWDEVKSYAEDIIGTIRKNDGDAVIIVGSPTWSQDVDLAAQNPLKGKNLMYSLHFYAGTHRESLRLKAQTAIDKGLALFVTEFGFCDASGNGSIDRQESARWMEYLDENQISFCMWSLCNKAETASALVPGCRKTGGWSSEDLSDAGKLLVEYLHGNVSGENTAENTAESGGAAETTETMETAKTGGCEAEAVQVNSWADADNSFFQYSVKLKNKDQAADSWELRISFTKEFQVEQGWCGSYQVKGKTLVVTPLDYNARLQEGAEIADIGFILRSSAGNRIKKLELILK